MSLCAASDPHYSTNVFDGAAAKCHKPSNLPAILKALEPFRDELTGVAVESTCNGYWLVDGLADHGYPMHRVNTAAVPQYDGLKYGGDDTDARHLAQLLRLDILLPRLIVAAAHTLPMSCRLATLGCVIGGVRTMGDQD